MGFSAPHQDEEFFLDRCAKCQPGIDVSQLGTFSFENEALVPVLAVSGFPP
jgi:hypothetical protein